MKLSRSKSIELYTSFFRSHNRKNNASVRHVQAPRISVDSTENDYNPDLNLINIQTVKTPRDRKSIDINQKMNRKYLNKSIHNKMNSVSKIKRHRANKSVDHGKYS